MIRTNLIDLMQRYITGQVTELERAKIEAWLDVKKTDEGADMVLDKEDEERLFQKIVANVNNLEEIRNFRPRKEKMHTMFSSRWLQYAATLLILALASYSIWFIADQNNPQEFIATSNMEKAILGDGSIVWLKKASTIKYGNSAQGREAIFTGEALFEVAKDPEKPFTISCGEVTVEVIGTSFNLKSSGTVFELQVLTGKVRLSTVTDLAGTIVHANEMASYNKAGGIYKAPINKNEISAIIAPTEYNMKFRNTAMENVISRIQSKFNVKVDVTDSLVTKCRITADFTDTSLRNTMNMLSELLDIEFKISGNTVRISGKGCS